MRVGKHEVACELLSRAIELYLRGDSYYSAIHLAGAAEEVFAVLIRHLPTASGKAEVAPIDQMKAAVVTLSSPASTQQAQQINDWAHNRMSEAKNSVKHMRGPSDAGVNFDPIAEAGDIVDRAISSYIQLGTHRPLPAVSGIAEFDAARRVHSAGECGLTLRWSGTSTGMALGPQGALAYRPPRGPSAIPAPAPQLKR